LRVHWTLPKVGSAWAALMKRRRAQSPNILLEIASAPFHKIRWEDSLQ